MPKADASFIRWPIPTTTDVAARVAIGDTTTGFPLLSLIEPREAALFSPDALIPRSSGAHYDLELVSDTGPAAEALGVLMLVAFNVPADRTAEVDRWYEQEHIGLLMRADGWLRARRYRVSGFAGGPCWTSMAFHELRDIGVMDSPERAAARSTPWRAELEREAWFGAAGRGVFRPLAV